MSRARKVGVAAALLTALAGFGVLCLFWFTGTYDPSLKGLFEYRSATVGDGLLLPVLIGVLAGAAVSLQAEVVPRRRRLSCAAAICGGLLGAFVIWRWLEDPDPSLNWTWPEPHQFNTAGWCHAVFLCTAGAAVAGLLTYVLLSLRARRTEKNELSFGPVALVAWAGVGMVGLILRDNQAASGTDAAAATAGAMVAAVVVGIAVVLWAGNRRMLGAVAVGAIAGLGTFGYCFEWPPQQVGVTVPMWLVLLPLAFALTEPLEQNGFTGRIVLFLASGVTAAGALALGIEQVLDEQLWSTLLFGAVAVLALVGAPIAFASGPLRRALLRDSPGTLGLSAFIVAALLVAAWLAYTPFDQQSALATLSAIELTFDLLVFTLFRNRFKDLVEAEAVSSKQPELDYDDAQHLRIHGELPKKFESEKQPEDKVSYGAVSDLYLTLYVFAFAALMTLVILLANAAGPIGLNDVVEGVAPDSDVLLSLGATLAAVLALGAGSIALAERSSKRHRDASKLGAGALAAGLAAAAALGSLALEGGDLHQPALAGAAALVYALLVVESLIFSPLRLQLDRVGRRRGVLIAATGLAVFAASFWLFSVGVWSGSGPAEVWRIGVASILVIGACLALSAIVGVVLAKSGSGRVVTPSPPDTNAALDQVLYALFMFLIGVFPITAVAHIDVSSEESFALVSSLMFIPGLFGAFIWVIDNNSTHHRAEQTRSKPSPAIWELANWGAKPAYDRLEEYKRSMLLHSRLQNWGATAALVSALVLVAAKLMGL